MHLPTTLLSLTTIALLPSLALAQLPLNFTAPGTGTKLDLTQTIQYAWDIDALSPDLEYDEMDMTFHIKDSTSWPVFTNESVRVGGGIGWFTLATHTNLSEANIPADARAFFEARLHDKNETGPESAVRRSMEYEVGEIKGNAAGGVRAGMGMVVALGMGVVGVLMV